VPESAWRRCQLLYLCSPGNPTGAVMDIGFLRRVLELADRHGFVDRVRRVLFGALCGRVGAAAVAAHRRARRGPLPLRALRGVPQPLEALEPPRPAQRLRGRRSGAAARFLLYRTYHGSAMPVPVQLASIAAWDDDGHAAANRELYRAKYAGVLPVLGPLLGL
jgi:N-succinyldiaminopimelate aminotransferase